MSHRWSIQAYQYVNLAFAVDKHLSHHLIHLLSFSVRQSLVTAFEEEVINTLVRLNDAVTVDGVQVITGYKNFVTRITINGSVNVADIDIQGKCLYSILNGGM